MPTRWTSLGAKIRETLFARYDQADVFDGTLPQQACLYRLIGQALDGALAGKRLPSFPALDRLCQDKIEQHLTREDRINILTAIAPQSLSMLASCYGLPPPQPGVSLEAYVWQQCHSSNAVHRKVSHLLFRKHTSIPHPALLDLDKDLPRHLLDNCQFMLACVRTNGLMLQKASDRLKQHHQLVLAAVQQNGWALKYAHHLLQEDITLVMHAVTENGFALQFASPSLKDNEEVVYRAVQKTWQRLPFQGNRLDYLASVMWESSSPRAVMEGLSNPLEFASSRIRQQFSLVLAAVQQDGMAWRYAHPSLQAHPTIAMAAVCQYPAMLAEMSLAQRGTLALVRAAVQQNGLMLATATDSLRHQLDLMSLAVQQNGMALLDAPSAMRSNADLVLQAVTQNPACAVSLSHALYLHAARWPELLPQCPAVFMGCSLLDRDNPSYARIAVQHDGLLLQFVSTRLQRDKTIVQLAVEQNGLALRFADSLLQDDEDVIAAAVAQNPLAMRYAAPWRVRALNRSQALALVRLDIDVLPLLADQWLADDAFVLQAIAGERPIPMLPKRFLLDRQLAYQAVRQNGRVLELLPFSWKNDLKMVEAAVQQNWVALLWPSARLRNHPKLKVAALRQNAKAMLLIENHLSSDEATT